MAVTTCGSGGAARRGRATGSRTGPVNRQTSVVGGRSTSAERTAAAEGTSASRATRATHQHEQRTRNDETPTPDPEHDGNDASFCETSKGARAPPPQIQPLR